MAALLAFMGSVDRVLAFVIKPVVVVVSLLVATMLAYGIFARAVLEKPVFGIEELVLLGAMWLYMLGAALASRDRTHLSADFVQVVSKSPRVIKGFQIFATLISLVMAVLIATWSYDLLFWAVKKGQTTAVMKMPLYLSQGSLFIASVLFVFYQTRDLLSDIISFRESANS